MAQNQDGIQFRYKFQKSQKLRYTVSVRGAVEVKTSQGSQSNPLHIEMIIDQSIIDIRDGKAEILLEIVSAKTFDGVRSAALPEEGEKSTLLMDECGQINYLSGTGSFQGMEFSQMHFPQHPLKAGESWSQNAGNGFGAGVNAKTRYVYTGMKNCDKRLCAGFEMELIIESKSDDGKGTERPHAATTAPNALSRGTTFFSPELGTVIKTTVDSQFTFQMPLPENPSELVTSTTTLRTEMQLIK